MDTGASPLFIACLNGHEGIVQRLLDNGADINLCTDNGYCPLTIAIRSGFDNIVKLLTANSADGKLH